MLHKNNRVSTRQGETQPAYVCRKEETVNTGVRVERLHYGMSLIGVCLSVQAHIGHRRHVRFEKIVFDDVQHLLHLTEDQDSMLTERSGGRFCIDYLAFYLVGRWRSCSDTTVNE